jgi:hypothetical protein
VSKRNFLLLPVVLAVTLAGAQMGQTSRRPESDSQNAISGSALTCSQPHTFVIPSRLFAKAKLKARLLILLRDSLYDDANGIVNIAREKEIKKLANKLKNDKDE